MNSEKIIPKICIPLYISKYKFMREINISGRVVRSTNGTTYESEFH
jgi:hypothetical protein